MNQIDVLKNDNSYKKKNPVTKINNNFDIEKCFFLLENNQKFVCKKNKFSLNEVKNILSGDDEPEIYNKYKLYHIHNYSFLKEKIESLSTKKM